MDILPYTFKPASKNYYPKGKFINNQYQQQSIWQKSICYTVKCCETID